MYFQKEQKNNQTIGLQEDDLTPKTTLDNEFKNKRNYQLFEMANLEIPSNKLKLEDEFRIHDQNKSR